MLSKTQQELAAAHEGLICKVIRQLRLDCTEYYGVGALALCKAAIQYDPLKGAAFSAYAVRGIRTAILQSLRDESAQKRRINQRTISHTMDQCHVYRSVYELIPGESDMESRCIRRLTIYQALKGLSLQERITAVMLWEGCSLTEISKYLNVSPQRVSQIKKNIKERLRMS